MSIFAKSRLQMTIDALCDGLRPAAVQFMTDFTHATVHDENNHRTIPLARRILNDYDVDFTVEVFVLSLQAHYNLYYEAAHEVISKYSADGEADTLAWLSVHYIIMHPANLTRANPTRLN